MAAEFESPDFLSDYDAEDVQERMMENLPEGLDDMPGGFPYDFTMPTAIEVSQVAQFLLVRVLMLMFSEWAWGDWLDLHAKGAGIERKEATYATGHVTVSGKPGTKIPLGSIFCTESTETTASVDFETEKDAVIPDSGTIMIEVTAVAPGASSNVKAGAVTFLGNNIKGVTGVVNENDMEGGTDEEDDDSLRERIELENDSQGGSFVGCDSDFVRWAKSVEGVGECTVVPCYNGPGTVKLVIVDSNHQPASERICQAVYDYIVSPNDRSKRLLATGSCELAVVPATTVVLSYECTGLEYDSSTSIAQIIEDFKALVLAEYSEAKTTEVIVYNQIRGIITAIPGVIDFNGFYINGSEDNIRLAKEEFATTGTVDFS